MRIAISGLSGCGNTTVSGLVAGKLGFEVINYTFRNMAEERGISFSEMCALARGDDGYDLELDAKQVSLAMARDNCVLASRLAIWMLKEADFKFYINVSAQERSRRIHKREGGSLEDRIAETKARDSSDTERYKRIYGIDNTKPEEVADYVISDDGMSAEQIADFIVSHVRTGR